MANHVILQAKNDSSIQLDNSSRRFPFCGGIVQFWTTNEQRAELTFAQRNRETERFQRLSTRNQRNSMRTGQLYNKRSTFGGTIPFRTSGFFFVSPIRIWLSSLSVSLFIQIQNFAWVGTIFDHSKRLRSPRRVQTRSRGTRTLSYAYWAGVCQSERAPALGENVFWCCVWGRT